MNAIFSVSPVVGVALPGTPSSTQEFRPGTQVFGSDGHQWMYVVAASALGSTDNLIVVAGQPSADATADAYPSADGVASALLGNYVAVHPGGIASGQYFWARTGQVGALT